MDLTDIDKMEMTLIGRRKLSWYCVMPKKVLLGNLAGLLIFDIIAVVS